MGRSVDSTSLTTSGPAMRERILGGDVVLRYPLYAPLLSRLTVVVNPDVDVMAVSGSEHIFTLHVNARFVDEQPEFVTGVVLHEIHHLMLGHVTDTRFREAESPKLMELAMEASANEYITEPLPGSPVTVESLARYGVKPGQSTFERYRTLIAAAPGHPELSSGRFELVDDHHDQGVGRMLEVGSVRARALRSRLRGTDEHPVANAGTLVEELWGGSPRTAHVDWRGVLRSFVAPERTRVASYKRPPRRFPQRLGEAPGYVRRRSELANPSVLIGLDTSGSMEADELATISNELEQLSHLARLTIVECDREIRRVYPFEGRLRDVAGRGGTDLRPVFASALLAGHAPGAIVYFTDGEGPYPGRDPGVPTLWVLTKERRKFRCPWGQRVTM